MNSDRPHRISILQGPASINRKTLSKTSFFFGRPDEKRGWEPDIDLSPDYKVSRKHARLYLDDGIWWLEDTGSRHGTKVGGKKIRKPVRLDPGVPVEMGDSVLMIEHADQHYVKSGELIVGFRAVPAINYALYHCGIPILSDFTIRNTGRSYAPPFKLSISVKGYSDEWQRNIDSIPSDGQTIFEKIHLPLHYEKLEGNEESKRARIEIRIGDEIVSNEEVTILGFYQWPTDSSYRRSLACFVQPSHPLVYNITLDATAFLKDKQISSSFINLLKTDREDKVDCALAALYECLRKRYQINYLPPPQSLEPKYQVVRPPHGVIYDSRNRRGGGTCIDTTLLFASCLENIGLQPLVILVSEKEYFQHSLLGCWKVVTERYDSIFADRDRLMNAIADTGVRKLYVLESTGITDRFERKLSYEESIRSAEEQLREKEFLYALDVSVLRQTIAPLQHPMSPGASDILRKAEEFARREKSNRLETKHLVLSLLLKKDKIRSVLVQAEVNLEAIDSLVSLTSQSSGGCSETAPLPTINYRRVIEDARLTASDLGLTYVDEIHLWYAILLSQSESVDQVFDCLSTSRKELKKIFDRHYTWTGEVIQTFSEL